MSGVLGALLGSYAPVSTAFESIATATGTGSSGTITFSSIPSTYQHLQIRALVKSTLASDTFGIFNLRANSDSGTNYSFHSLRASTLFGVLASGTASDVEINPSLWMPHGGSTYLVNIMGVAIIDILDYASTSKYKTFRMFSGADANNTTSNTNEGVTLGSGLWQSTSAINSLTLRTNNGSWTTSTQFALYGIKGA